MIRKNKIIWSISYWILPQIGFAGVVADFPLHFLESDNPIEKAFLAQVRPRLKEGLLKKVLSLTDVDLPKSFSRDYGNGRSLAGHLVSPMGSGSLKRSKVIPIGFAVGLGLVKADSLASLPGLKAIPINILPSIDLGINTGFSFTPNFDIRFTYFPLSEIFLPGITRYRLKNGIIRIAANYSILDNDRLFGFGLAFGVYLSHSTGALALTRPIDAVNADISGATMNLRFINTQFNSKWVHYGGGAEIRLHYALLFFLPYLGFGLGLEYGKTESLYEIILNINGTYDLKEMTGITARMVNIVQEKGKILISGDARSAIIPIRLLLGFEFNFYKLSTIIEIQYLLNSGVIGFSYGINFLI